MMSYISVHNKNHKFKFLCYKSEVKTFDPSGDSTLPTYPKKRKIEQVDKEDEVIEKKAKKAKVKIEVEEEEVEDVEEQETSVKKKRKDKKKHVKEEPLAEEEPCTSTAVASAEKKKKKKKKKVNEDSWKEPFFQRVHN